MNIGIDFDNTIAKYDSLFQKVAQTNKFVLKNLHGYGNILLRLTCSEERIGCQNLVKVAIIEKLIGEDVDAKL